ncbi:MAG: AsmA-like C-terminal region-containing protein [Vicinamibacterales bacterium]|nr:AsmA-like C-terminal region-containing protein [Vicinamibacterales bacterium]
MLKKVAIGIVALVIVGGLGIVVLARTVLTGDAVRTALAAQVSDAIGQPVSIGGIGASVYPRVTIDLTDVAIGQPARIQLRSLHLGAGLGALFSRRIEQAAIRIDGARLELPLPDLGAASAGSAPPETPGVASTEPPSVEIVSIDEIVLTNVEVVSGGRTLRGDIELLPQGHGVQLRRVSLVADDARVEMTGAITSLSPLEGRIDAVAGEVDFDQLLAFMTDFASTTEPSTGPGTGLDGRLTFTLALDRATTGGLALSEVSATALVTADAVRLEPLTFGVFGGRYDGTMAIAMSVPPQFEWRATVRGIDADALMTFGESPDTISGTLEGSVALNGSGAEMAQAMRTARGTARVDIADGAVEGLGLVRTFVTATSGRGGILTSARTAAGAGGAAAEAERFSHLGASLTFADGLMRTSDFTMTSTDVELTGAGTITLASMTTDLTGQARLSEALSKEAGTDFYRYAQEGGRITLPAIITGPMEHLSVRIDVGDAASRAIRNRAAEEAQKVIERNVPNRLRGLVPRRPPGR